MHPMFLLGLSMLPMMAMAEHATFSSTNGGNWNMPTSLPTLAAFESKDARQAVAPTYDALATKYAAHPEVLASEMRAGISANLASTSWIKLHRRPETFVGTAIATVVSTAAATPARIERQHRRPETLNTTATETVVSTVTATPARTERHHRRPEAFDTAATTTPARAERHHRRPETLDTTATTTSARIERHHLRRKAHSHDVEGTKSNA